MAYAQTVNTECWHYGNRSECQSTAPMPIQAMPVPLADGNTFRGVNPNAVQNRIDQLQVREKQNEIFQLQKQLLEQQIRNAQKN